MYIVHKVQMLPAETGFKPQLSGIGSNHPADRFIRYIFVDILTFSLLLMVFVIVTISSKLRNTT